jgi:hypothetical protein
VKLKDPRATRATSDPLHHPRSARQVRAGRRNLAFFSIGGGYELFEHSALTQSGQPNKARCLVSHGAFMYGGGVDVKVWRFVRLRREARPFYTGKPAFNVPLSGGQHNPAVSAALVFALGRPR